MHVNLAYVEWGDLNAYDGLNVLDNQPKDSWQILCK